MVRAPAILDAREGEVRRALTTLVEMNVLRVLYEL